MNITTLFDVCFFKKLKIFRLFRSSPTHLHYMTLPQTPCQTFIPNTQVQHGMGPLINMQKSVFLPLWDNHELYDRKILHIESFSAKESENLVKIVKFFILKEYACAASENDKMKKRNILHLSEAVGILRVLSISADLAKINWALSIFPLSGKYMSLNFSSLA